MAVKKIIYDKDQNELVCYPNGEGDLCIGISKETEDIYGGYITLKRDDVKELIALLQEYEDQINED